MTLPYSSILSSNTHTQPYTYAYNSHRWHTLVNTASNTVAKPRWSGYANGDCCELNRQRFLDSLLGLFSLELKAHCEEQATLSYQDFFSQINTV